ncbi:MAG: GNAT family N-acetyltransferase [Pseudonocardiaceae bacterium]
MVEVSISATDFQISTDQQRLDVDWLHNRLSTDTYWAPGRPRERVEKAVANSTCYGVYHPDGHQVAFARLVTDHTVFAWLGDMYVDRSVRGIGIAKRLVGRIMDDFEPLAPNDSVHCRCPWVVSAVRVRRSGA